MCSLWPATIRGTPGRLDTGGMEVGCAQIHLIPDAGHRLVEVHVVREIFFRAAGGACGRPLIAHSFEPAMQSRQGWTAPAAARRRSRSSAMPWKDWSSSGGGVAHHRWLGQVRHCLGGRMIAP